MSGRRREEQQPGALFGRGPVHALGLPVEKPRDFRGTAKRLAGYLKPRRRQLAAVMLMAALSATFGIVGPKVMGLATTSLFESLIGNRSVNFAYLGQILLTLGGLYLFSALFNFAQQYIMASAAQNTIYALREDINQKLFRLPLKYFDDHSHGDTLSRVTNDVDNISGTLQQSLTQLMAAAVMLVGILVMMLVISPLLSTIAFIILPLSFLVTKSVAARSQKYFSRQQQALGDLNGHIEEMFSGHLLVKAFGREKESLEQFGQINEQLYAAGWKAQFVSGIIMPLLMFINNIGYVLVCIFGSILVIRGSITIGDVQAFIQYARQFTHPIAQTANIANILQSTVASAERIFELLDEAEEPPDTDWAAPKSPGGDVRFENVRFGYTKENLLLEDLNIEVSKGQTVAIVGPTGAGKTTLVNLLMRFYDIDSGRITVDGMDIRDLKRGHLRTIFGMVLQDTWLFNGTIRDNIAYGRTNATERQIFHAARVAYADQFIRTLPEGYDTVLNEEASNISQGQKQLITIARAILADPAILILDEATSSVDSRTELLIQKAMKELMRGRTNFVIAHRLSTIRDADIILVMNEGEIVEKGNHRELLDLNGFYAELYAGQFPDSAEKYLRASKPPE